MSDFRIEDIERLLKDGAIDHYRFSKATAKELIGAYRERERLESQLAAAERLMDGFRTNAEYWHAETMKAYTERDRLRAENEKLVKALERIALNGVDRHATNPGTGVALGVWSVPAGWNAQDEARKALADAGRGREG